MLELKKLHDLLVLRITQPDKEGKKFPLVQIVGRAGVEWIPEVPVDKGWIDIYVPIQKGIEAPYVIEVQTGYDFNCSGILQQLERFRRAMMETNLGEVAGVSWPTQTYVLAPRPPKLCVVIPSDFAEFLPLFRPKEISVFLWKGTLEWECTKCKEITPSSGPWKPMTCNSTLCGKKQRSFSLVGLTDFKIKQADV